MFNPRIFMVDSREEKRAYSEVRIPARGKPGKDIHGRRIA